MRTRFRDNVDALCVRAYELGDTHPAGVALACWLRIFVRHAVANRGLAAPIALTLRAGQPTPHLAGCHGALLAAGGPPSATADGPSEQTSVGFEHSDRLLALVADGWRLGGSVASGASGSVAMGRAGAPQQR